MIFQKFSNLNGKNHRDSEMCSVVTFCYETGSISQEIPSPLPILPSSSGFTLVLPRWKGEVNTIRYFFHLVENITDAVYAVDSEAAEILGVHAEPPTGRNECLTTPSMWAWRGAGRQATG